MRNARDGGGGALADAQNGEGHAINDWVIQIQKQDGRVLRRRRWKKKKPTEIAGKNRYCATFALVPLRVTGQSDRGKGVDWSGYWWVANAAKPTKPVP